jgi:hypothetical protein
MGKALVCIWLSNGSLQIEKGRPHEILLIHLLLSGISATWSPLFPIEFFCSHPFLVQLVVFCQQFVPLTNNITQ